MAIDIHNDEVLTLTEAAKRLPHRRAGRPTHVATLHRWASRGVRGVKLESAMIGGVKVTSAEALDRFIAALSGPQPGPALGSREKEIAAAERRLAAAGV